MTVTDQIKILNRKITQNESQYHLDREAAKISALSSNNLDEYELLTGEDLDLKPSTIEQAKFENSPLGKVFNKGLSEDDKKEGILKRLKNIEDKNKVKNKNIIGVTNFVDEPLSLKAKGLTNEIKTIQKNVDYRKLKFKGGNNVDYDFRDYKTFKELFRDLCYRQFTIDEAKSKQDEFSAVLTHLKIYNPRDNKYIKAKNSLVNNASNFYKGREKIIRGFKNKIFPIYYDERESFKKEDEEDEREKQQEELKKKKDDFNLMIEQVTDKLTNKQVELFNKHFHFQTQFRLLRKIYQTSDTEENTKLVSLINSGLKDLRKEAKEMTEIEKMIKDPELTVNIVEKILKFNEEGIKILTPNQMLNRLPIALAQLKAGNNSNKLKNEIRQLLYSLYRSKNMNEQIYNSLIGTI